MALVTILLDDLILSKNDHRNDVLFYRRQISYARLHCDE